MNNLYGVKGIKVRVFDFEGSLNDFLNEYDGNIIDIQTVQKYESSIQYVVIYKEIED